MTVLFVSIYAHGASFACDIGTRFAAHASVVAQEINFVTISATHASRALHNAFAARCSGAAVYTAAYAASLAMLDERKEAQAADASLEAW